MVDAYCPSCGEDTQADAVTGQCVRCRKLAMRVPATRDLREHRHEPDLGPLILKPHRGRLNGRWSRKHEACISCGTSSPSTPHKAKGLCQRCQAKPANREMTRALRHA